LKPGYEKQKTRRGLAPVRDWTWRGRTLRSLSVKSANENHVVIGFSDPEADGIAHVNNLRERAFGVSPGDRNALTEIVLATLRSKRIVRFQRVA
jgi:poly-gamma-glutamate capsule biosynthesis protein CapA/YwtB (metallophosphatase superfamily)